jgi:Tol biopolymer transport system component
VLRHRWRTLGGVLAAVVVLAAVLVVVGDDEVDVSADATATTEPSTTTIEEATTTTASSTTTTTAATTTTTAAPATTAPPPPTTAAPRRMFGVQSSPQGLAVMNSDGTDRRLLVEGAFRSLDLAPNRAWLVMVNATGGSNQLVTVNADGSGLRVIDDGSWQSPRISPDGQRIAAIELVEAVGPVLVLMNRDGGGRQVIHPPKGSTNSVDWSPDGTRLAVTNSSSNGLAVYDLASGQQQVIRPRPGTTGSPIWSPDGALIAFNDGADLVVIAASGGPDRVVTGGVAERPRELAWDGSSSLLFSAGATLYRIGVDGSGLSPVANGVSSPAI